MTRDRADIDAFLDNFFGDANRFDLAEIEGGTEGKTGRIHPWIARLREHPPQFSILPCWREGKHVDWYAVAHSEQELRKLREELLAFVGPSYSNFRGQRAALDRSDPVEASVLDLTRGAAFKFQGANTREGARDVWNALELMRKTWGRRTKRGFEVLRPKGRVLRDFYMALQAGNATSAEQHLAYLEAHTYLDAHNLLFLRIQLCATFVLWQDILNLPGLPDILQMRRPLSVTQAVIQAVYNEELASFEATGDTDGAIHHFRSRIWHRYRQLYTVYAGMKAHEAVKSFMLLAVSSTPPRPGLCERLLDIPGVSEADRRYLETLADTLIAEEPETVSGDLLQQALNSLAENDFDQAYGLALDGVPSPRRTQLLIRCSYELQTLQSRRVALQAFQDLVAEERAQFLQSRWNQNLLEALREAEREDEQTIPTSWPDWFARLQSDTEWHPEEALQVAREGAMEWEVAELLAEPDAVASIGEVLKSARAEETLHNALPTVLSAFQNDPHWPRREFLSIYWGMLELLVYSTSGGDDDLSVFNDLVVAILTFGVEKNQYQEILEYGIELWNAFASPSKIDWILDFIDLLCLYPRVADDPLLTVLTTATAGFKRFFKRIEAEQWSMFRLLCEDLDQNDIFEGLKRSGIEINEEELSQVEDQLSVLQDKSVAIYTLTESVGRRVRDILEHRCEGVQVHVCSEKVGTPQLRDLARHADIFVMATASATHAATGFIKSNRPDSPILYPKGKGSTSMLRAIYAYIRQNVMP